MQISGFLAIEGISSSQEVFDVYKCFIDPSNQGMKLLRNIAFGGREYFSDEDRKTITV